MTATTVYLFSYGILQDKAVQLANFGRELTGSADAMLRRVVSRLYSRNRNLRVGKGYAR